MTDEAGLIGPELPGFSKLLWLKAAHQAVGRLRLSGADYRALIDVFNQTQKDGRGAVLTAEYLAARCAISGVSARRSLSRLCDLGLIVRRVRGARIGATSRPSSYDLGSVPQAAATRDLISQQVSADRLECELQQVSADRLGQFPTDQTGSFPTDQNRSPQPIRADRLLRDAYSEREELRDDDDEAAAAPSGYVTREGVIDVVDPSGEPPITAAAAEADALAALLDEFAPILSPNALDRLDQLAPDERRYALAEYRRAKSTGIKYQDGDHPYYTVRWSSTVLDRYMDMVCEQSGASMGDAVKAAIIDASSATRMIKVAERIHRNLADKGPMTGSQVTKLYSSNQKFSDGNRGRDLVPWALQYLVASGAVHQIDNRYELRADRRADTTNQEK